MKLDIAAIKATYEKEQGTLQESFALLHQRIKLGIFCDRCGETNPPNHFYPLYHYPSVSGVTCNECYLTDAEYVKSFHETKEEARKRCQNTQ